MRSRAFAITMAALALLGAGAGTALAGLIDLRRAAAGAEPYSDLLLDTQPAWALLLRPSLTAPTAPPPGTLRPAEVGVGIAANLNLGQVQEYHDIDGRLRRVIWDLLALQPVPRVLYLDPHPVPGPQPDGPPALLAERRYPAGDGRTHASSGGGRSRTSGTPQTVPIPEPSSLLLALGGLVVACRRNGTRRWGGAR
jgi:hypothetical protein